MAKDRDIRYAEYDYGQPDGEKRGLHIRNRSGDNRFTIFVLGAFALIMLIGAVFAIPGVRNYFEGRKNMAEIAFGVEYQPVDNCWNRRLRLADLHAHTPLDEASRIDVTVILLTKSKGELSRTSRPVFLDGIDWDNPPSPMISVRPQMPERQNVSVPWQCQVALEIIE